MLTVTSPATLRPAPIRCTLSLVVSLWTRGQGRSAMSLASAYTYACDHAYNEATTGRSRAGSE